MKWGSPTGTLSPAQAAGAQVASGYMPGDTPPGGYSSVFSSFSTFLCIAANWVGVDKNIRTNGAKHSPVDRRSVRANFLVPSVELLQVLPGVEPRGPHDLQREAQLRPPTELLRLAVHVVSSDDHVHTFPLPDDLRGSLLRVWEVTTGSFDGSSGLDVSYAQHAARLRQSDVAVRGEQWRLVTGPAVLSLPVCRGHPLTDLARLPAKHRRRPAPDHCIRHVLVEQNSDAGHAVMQLHLQVLDAHLLPRLHHPGSPEGSASSLVPGWPIP